MNRIDSYLNNVFSSYPETEKTIAVKKRMREMLNQKLNYFMERGKNEDEAMGILVQEFGDMKEIDGMMEDVSGDIPKVMNWSETSDCIKKYTKGGTIVAFGACFIVFAYMIMGLVKNLFGPYNGKVYGAVTLVMAVVGFAIILFGGSFIQKAKDILSYGAMLDLEAYEKASDLYEAFRKKYYIHYFVSILLFAISPIFALLDKKIGGVLFFITIIIALFVFIRTGNENSIYKRILKKRGWNYGK